MSEHDELAGVLDQVEARLEGIQTALLRLEEGTYRNCEECGHEIDDAGLAADPTERCCLECRSH